MVGKFLLFANFIFVSTGFAEPNFDVLRFEGAASTPQASSYELFLRTQSVLDYYGVPEEEDPSLFLQDVQNLQNLAGLKKQLPFMDPHGMLKRLATLNPSTLSMFQDLDSKQVFDTSVALTASDLPTAYTIGNPLDRTGPLPLTGLKVALDPGHMGGRSWDNLTGKYIKDSQGTIVSEGTTVLQIALLLKTELEKLGATVLVTRDSLKPVTTDNLNTYDTLPYALNEIRESIHLPWFQKLIAKNAAGTTLFQLFDQSPQIKRIFSKKERANYFIFRSDLAARSDMINDFKPDIALILHLDVAVSNNNPQGLNAKAPYETRAFVFGAYDPTEFASRADRKYFINHLLDDKSWSLSLDLSRSITQQLQSDLGLRLSRQTAERTVLVEPGIISRNLGVTRRLKVPAVSYLECLYYNRPDEFKLLSDTKHSMIIEGKNIPYSDRVVKIVQSLKKGILKFADTH